MASRKEIREKINGFDWPDDVKESVLKVILDVTHNETDSLRDQIDELSEKLEQAQADITAANAEKEKAVNDFADYKNAETQRMSKDAKAKAYREILKQAGVSEKRIDTLVKVADIDSLEIGADGKIANAESIAESIKAEYPEFIVSRQAAGAETPTPPQTNPQQNYSMADISRMSAEEINKNWDAVKASLKSN